MAKRKISAKQKHKQKIRAKQQHERIQKEQQKAQAKAEKKLRQRAQKQAERESVEKEKKRKKVSRETTQQVLTPKQKKQRKSAERARQQKEKKKRIQQEQRERKEQKKQRTEQQQPKSKRVPTDEEDEEQRRYAREDEERGEAKILLYRVERAIDEHTQGGARMAQILLSIFNDARNELGETQLAQNLKDADEETVSYVQETLKYKVDSENGQRRINEFYKMCFSHLPSAYESRLYAEWSDEDEYVNDSYNYGDDFGYASTADID